MTLADPWGSSVSSNIQNSASLQFEDNFEPTDIFGGGRSGSNSSVQQPQDGRLPDSDSYLALLERKLNKLKTNPTVLEQLAERREACMQYLLNDSNQSCRTDSDLDLEEPVHNHELLRFIRPEQALSVAELVHLVKYDHLVQGPTEQEQCREGEESGTESSTSR